jgi:hypothetical protein
MPVLSCESRARAAELANLRTRLQRLGYFMRRRLGGDSTYILLDNSYAVDDGEGTFAMTEELLDRASDAVEALDPDDYRRHISRVLMEYYDPSEEPTAFVDRMLTRADIRCTAAARARAIGRVAAFGEQLRRSSRN